MTATSNQRESSDRLYSQVLPTNGSGQSSSPQPTPATTPTPPAQADTQQREFPRRGIKLFSF